MGEISFWYFQTIWLRKKLKNLILKKDKILGMAWIGLISADWNFRVANFGFNYLRHFSINFGNSCAHLAANFLRHKPNQLSHYRRTANHSKRAAVLFMSSVSINTQIHQSLTPSVISFTAPNTVNIDVKIDQLWRQQSSALQHFQLKFSNHNLGLSLT